MEEGDAIPLTFIADPDNKFSYDYHSFIQYLHAYLLRNNRVNTYYMKPETYEWVFKEAGFTHFEWYPLILHPNATEEEKKHFQPILDKPISIGMVAW